MNDTPQDPFNQKNLSNGQDQPVPQPPSFDSVQPDSSSSDATIVPLGDEALQFGSIPEYGASANRPDKRKKVVSAIFISAFFASLILIVGFVIYPWFVAKTTEDQIRGSIERSALLADGQLSFPSLQVQAKANNVFAAFTGKPKVKFVKIDIPTIMISEKSAESKSSPADPDYTRQGRELLNNLRTVLRQTKNVDEATLSIGSVTVDGKEIVDFGGSSLKFSRNSYSVRVNISRGIIEKIKKEGGKAGDAAQMYLPQLGVTLPETSGVSSGISKEEAEMASQTRQLQPTKTKEIGPTSKNQLQDQINKALADLTLEMRGDTIKLTVAGETHVVSVTPAPDGKSLKIIADGDEETVPIESGEYGFTVDTIRFRMNDTIYSILIEGSLKVNLIIGDLIKFIDKQVETLNKYPKNNPVQPIDSVRGQPGNNNFPEPKITPIQPTR